MLIIEDQEDIRASLTAILEDAGHKVASADDGATGLDMAAVSQPEIILLDIAMPGVDGIETLRRLKASPATRGSTVIMVTAHGKGEYLLMAAQYGARDIIHKPWEPGEVELVVGWALKERMRTRVAAS
jgi:DNA-binding response OmpR family regulator